MSLLLLFKGTGGYTPAVSTYGYTQPKDVIVRVQALDGLWETCGADRARGVWPENVQLTSDQWGSKTASFDLRRDPKAIWPDIGAFAPVEVEVGGRLVWSGRVSETPVRDSTDSVINVQCEGWQSHLDDDLYERIYVHTNIADYVDARSFPAADLSRTGTAAGQVQAGDGGLSLSFPQGTALTGGVSAYAAAILDLGPNSLAKRVVFDAMAPSRTATGSKFGFHCRTLDAPTFAATTFDDVLATDITTLSTSTATTYAATVPTAHRYVMFFLYHSGAASFTTAEDNTVKITNVQVFADTAYESGNASILKADQVVKDALSRATLQLSTDQTSVSAGTFSIPELAPGEPRTPRQMWDAVNAFEDYQAKVDVLRRPIYRAKPTTPEVEVGAWSGMEFEDSSANAGEDVYTGVVITGTQADGSPLRVTRTQSQQAGVLSTALSSPSMTNPSFTTNTSGWSVSGASSTITRDTATFDSSPASLRWDLTGASDGLNNVDISYLTGTTSGTFLAGVTYTATIRFRPSVTSSAASLRLWFGTTTDRGWAYTKFGVTAGGWWTATVSWTPTAKYTAGVSLILQAWYSPPSTANVFYNIDEVAINAAQPTIVERRGFARTKQVASSFTLTTTAAQQIADKWLLAHKTSPFKGRAKLTGNYSCRDIKTGRPVSPEQLLLRTGELIRFNDRIDPDTGAVGRDGRLVEAQYDADSDSVNLTIDSSRAGFEALLERLGVVLGQNRFS